MLLTAWAGWPGQAGEVDGRFALAVEPVSVEDAPPRLTSALINAAQPLRVHAPSIVALPDGRLFATWFGGTREGATDVNIYAAYRAADELAWGPQQVIASPQQTTRDTGFFTRKLGNPVALLTPGGELWVIYVSVTMGGWATSQLNLLRSPDLGQHWRPASRLVTSPFFNLSTLVKGVPVFFANGDIGVPVYHELAGKFAELLVLAPTGEVRRKIRMDHGRRTLQPVVLVQDTRRAVALMRTASGTRAWRGETEDGGLHWRTPQETTLANPNSALAAFRLGDGRLLAVANDTEDQRLRLSLLVSEDEGWHWRAIHRFEDRQESFGQTLTPASIRAATLDELDRLGPGPEAEAVLAKLERNLCKNLDEQDGREGEADCGWQYDYPYIIQDAKGDFHLVYTWNRSFIRHISFNMAWLRQRLEQTQ
ncbi:MAG: exo-alpha-sialidase [Azoarcus sp.]|nr:exo-alpha-sialidase [Azoarcus sp.]